MRMRRHRLGAWVFREDPLVAGPDNAWIFQSICATSRVYTPRWTRWDFRVFPPKNPGNRTASGFRKGVRGKWWQRGDLSGARGRGLPKQVLPLDIMSSISR